MGFRTALFSFDGRIGRFAYFKYSSVGMAIVLFTLLFLAILLKEVRAASAVVGVAFVAVWLWATSALVAKRLHDMNLSGWHVGWILPTSVGLLALGSVDASAGILGGLGSLLLGGWLMFRRGSLGENAYGPPP